MQLSAGARAGWWLRPGPLITCQAGLGGSTYGRQLVETGKELVEELHQLLGAAGRGELGEAHDVCEEDAAGSNGERLSPRVSPSLPPPLLFCQGICTRAKAILGRG